MSVELLGWSGYGALFIRLDKYRVFFHTSNCQSASSLYAYRAIPFNFTGSNPNCLTFYRLIDVILSHLFWLCIFLF